MCYLYESDAQGDHSNAARIVLDNMPQDVEARLLMQIGRLIVTRQGSNSTDMIATTGHGERAVQDWVPVGVVCSAAAVQLE